MTLQWLIEHFGYLAVLIGGMLEGETVLVLGGLAAHRGYLRLPAVITAAAAGTLVGTQIYFQVGRRRGEAWLALRPRWRARAERVLALAQRHQTWAIFVYRFLYGVRTLTPFVLGMTGVSPLRFTLLDGLATLLWATGVASLGYALGNLAEQAVRELHRYEHYLFAGVAAAGALLWLARFARERRRDGAAG